MNELSVGQCFSDGWAAMKKHMAPAILGTLVYILISGAMGMVPYLGPVASLLLTGPLLGGLFYLFLNVIMDRNPEVGNVFQGFSRFGQFLGTYLLMALIGLVGVLPGMVLVFVGLASEAEAIIVIGAIFAFVGYIVVLVFMLRYFCVFFILADDPNVGVIDAFKLSATMTQGRRGTIFLLLLVSWLLAIAGYLACCVGIFFAAPLAMCVIAAAYRQLKIMTYGPQSVAPPVFPGQPPHADPGQFPYAAPGQSPYAAPGQQFPYGGPAPSPYAPPPSPPPPPPPPPAPRE